MRARCAYALRSPPTNSLHIPDPPSKKPSLPHRGSNPRLLQPKPFRVQDREAQPVRHLVTALVLRQQQRVEAGVGGGQLQGVGAVALDDALERAQAADGGPAGGWRGGWGGGSGLGCRGLRAQLMRAPSIACRLETPRLDSRTTAPKAFP